MEKACITSRNKVFILLTQLISEINPTDLVLHNVEIGTRDEYTVEYCEYILKEYTKLLSIDTNTFVHGNGKRKTSVQRHYEKLKDFTERLKNTQYISRPAEKQETAIRK